MHHSVVANLIVKEYVPTDLPCLRCITAYSDGETECFAKHGCHFFDIDEADEDKASIFDESKVVTTKDGEEVTHQFLVCHRCFLIRQECIAVPGVYLDALKAINSKITRIRQYHDKVACILLRPGEKGYVQPVAATETTAAVEAVMRRQTANEYLSAEKTLSSLCKNLMDKVGRTHYPQAEHCFLHNGALREGDDPNSSLHPKSNTRARASLLAKESAKNTHLSTLTSEALEEMQTPSKKKRKIAGAPTYTTPKNKLLELKAQLKHHEDGMAADDAAKAVAPRGSKQAFVDSKRAHKKRIDALEVQIKALEDLA